MTTKKAPEFESTPCRRCGGSGEFWYRSAYGKHCFGCRGRGHKLTKRGEAARDWYNEKIKIPAIEAKHGQRVFIEAFSINGSITGRVTVDKVSVSNEFTSQDGTTHRSYELLSVKGTTYRLKGDSVWLVPTKEQRAAWIKEALAYQDSLTKAGKPRKNRKRAAQTAMLF